MNTDECASNTRKYSESISTNENYDYLPINFPQNILNSTQGISSDFTFEFEVKAQNDAHILFCGDQVIDPLYDPRTQNDKCMELVIGGWDNGRSTFRGSAGDQLINLIIPFIYHDTDDSKPLDPDNFRLFKISFTETGAIQVFRVSNATKQLEYNNLPRDENGVLTETVDNDYYYDQTPWMERNDWVNYVRSIFGSDMIQSVKSIGFATGWGSAGEWNVIVKNLGPCGANGSCVDGIDSFTCECDAGWEGDLCTPF